MATTKNERDKILEAATTRLVDVDSPNNFSVPTSRNLQLWATSPIFAVGKSGASNPTSLTIIANLTGMPQGTPITWSVVTGTATLQGVGGNARTLNFTDMVSDIVQVRASVVVSGSPFSADYTITKVREGLDGVSPVAYSISLGSTALYRSALGVLSSPTVTFRSFSRVGSEAPISAYAGRFVISTSDGPDQPYTQRYTSAVDETTTTFSVPAGTKDVRVQLFKSGGLTEELDRSNVPVIDDGVKVSLEIESSNGTVFRVGKAKQTTLTARVFRNEVDVTASVPASKFYWTRVSMEEQPSPHDDASWNAAHVQGFKQILVSVDDVLSRATFRCQILE